MLSCSVLFWLLRFNSATLYFTTSPMRNRIRCAPTSFLCTDILTCSCFSLVRESPNGRRLRANSFQFMMKQSEADWSNISRHHCDTNPLRGTLEADPGRVGVASTLASRACWCLQMSVLNLLKVYCSWSQAQKGLTQRLRTALCQQTRSCQAVGFICQCPDATRFPMPLWQAIESIVLF